MKEFTPHAYLCINNSSVMEIEVDDANERIRVDDNGKVSRWIMIRYNRDGSAYFMKYGKRWKLNDFMIIL